jgi:hypothetical protein
MIFGKAEESRLRGNAVNGNFGFYFTKTDQHLDIFVAIQGHEVTFFGFSIPPPIRRTH